MGPEIMEQDVHRSGQKNWALSSVSHRKRDEFVVPLLLLQRVRIARSAERCNSQRDSVCPFVRSYVTFRYCVQTNEDTIVWFSAYGIEQSL